MNPMHGFTAIIMEVRNTVWTDIFLRQAVTIWLVLIFDFKI
jgi:hypothetical protein